MEPITLTRRRFFQALAASAVAAAVPLPLGLTASGINVETEAFDGRMIQWPIGRSVNHPDGVFRGAWKDPQKTVKKLRRDYEVTVRQDVINAMRLHGVIV